MQRKYYWFGYKLQRSAKHFVLFKIYTIYEGTANYTNHYVEQIKVLVILQCTERMLNLSI